MRVRSIPPVTSTGSNRRRTPDHGAGLAKMSIGRYMSEMAKKRKEEEEGEEDNTSWNMAKHATSDFNRKSKKKITTYSINVTEHKINCVVDMIDDYNEEGDFAIKLKFSGIEFSGDTFNLIDSDHATRGYFIPVLYQQKPASLFVMTIGDIFEYEVVSYDDSVNRIFSDEFYIPKLLHTYDSLSMIVTLKDNDVLVNYKNK